jgi:hypothetical protein
VEVQSRQQAESATKGHNDGMEDDEDDVDDRGYNEDDDSEAEEIVEKGLKAAETVESTAPGEPASGNNTTQEDGETARWRGSCQSAFDSNCTVGSICFVISITLCYIGQSGHNYKY